MRTMKFLMCVACLSSAAVFSTTALTQEKAVIPPVTDRLKSADDLQSPLPVRRPEPLTRLEVDSNEQRSMLTAPGGNSLFPNENLPTPADDPNFGDLRVVQERPADATNYLTETITRSSPAMRPRRVMRTVIETVYEPIPQEELEASIELRAAVQSLKTGKDEAARKAAADLIQQQLTTQFESDLKQREKELAAVEQRVKTLREQLDRRKAAQADIINLRLQTLVNQANGLGFPDEDFGTVDLFGRSIRFLPAAESNGSDFTPRPLGRFDDAETTRPDPLREPFNRQ